jgi:pimeloyl-ACP methyl ester carboxylesterase
MPEVTVKGRRFFYEETGQGEAIVFLSGLGGDHRAFAVPMRAFGKAFRALALDNRDSGRSDRVDAPYTTADMADDVAGWFHEIGLGSAHVVGQSLGGLVAQELALRHPKAVKSLTLVSTHAGSSPWKKAVVASWAVLKARTSAGEFARATLPWLVAPGFYRNTAQIEGLVRFAERNEWPQDADAFARQAQAASGHDLHDHLGRIRVPTLVLSGALDLVNPPDVAAELAGLIPGARLTLMEGVGHVPHVENAGAFREAVEAFLRSLP